MIMRRDTLIVAGADVPVNDNGGRCSLIRFCASSPIFLFSMILVGFP